MNPIETNILLMKIGAAGLILLALLFYRHHLIETGDAAGYKRANGEWVDKEAKISAGALLAKADADKQTEAKQKAMQDKLNAEIEKRMKGEKDHETTIARYESDARAGARKLYIATNHPASEACAAKADSDSAAAGRPDSSARSELMPETAGDIFRIAGGIAKLVRDNNALIGLYNEARSACNAVPDIPETVQ